MASRSQETEEHPRLQRFFPVAGRDSNPRPSGYEPGAHVDPRATALPHGLSLPAGTALVRNGIGPILDPWPPQPGATAAEQSCICRDFLRVSDGTRTRDRLDHNTVRHSSGLRLTRRNALPSAVLPLQDVFDSSRFQGVPLPPCCHRSMDPNARYGIDRTASAMTEIMTRPDSSAARRQSRSARCQPPLRYRA
jgi:hypothetical protein